mmetsp:Transcript_8029/g.22088  ORF Transcript_8029/g.22088 Transcript_8029/m.22088 type:complete len:331 (-) Transcript_8029:367-1359(-)
MTKLTLISAERHVEPATFEASALDGALVAIAAHLAPGRFAAKERIDVSALATHGDGYSFAQWELVPEDVFARVRQEYDIAGHVLLAPSPSSEAIVAFYDAHGAMKGLPTNERASRLTAAAGAKADIRGDCFIARVSSASGGAPWELAADFVPADITAREWLLAAQNSHDFLPDSLAGQLSTYLHAQSAVAKVKHAAQVSEGAGAPTAPAVAAEPETEAGENHSSAEAELTWKDENDQGEQGEVHVQVLVPARTIARDITCVITADHMSLRVATLAADKQVVIDGKLFQRVDPDDSNWVLESAIPSLPTRTLAITLGKEKKMRWLTLTRPG